MPGIPQSVSRHLTFLYLTPWLTPYCHQPTTFTNTQLDVVITIYTRVIIETDLFKVFIFIINNVINLAACFRDYTPCCVETKIYTIFEISGNYCNDREGWDVWTPRGASGYFSSERCSHSLCSCNRGRGPGWSSSTLSTPRGRPHLEGRTQQR